MSKRQKTSKGQAIVMVTLGLVAMCGLLGLAVDLGWSFFVKKQAQASADAAALAAVQEAMARLAGSIVIGCSGTDVNSVWCTANAAIVDCSSITAPSNLYNGCLYAGANGFSSATSRQKVTIQSYNQSILPTTPSGGSLGVNNLVYWVTVRTVQTIPQLFSAVLGNTQGTISAIATAAIVSTVVPGQFYGMNDRYDCMGLGNNCGMDISLQGSGGVYAPGGIVLSSNCAATGPGCTNLAVHASNASAWVDAVQSEINIPVAGTTAGQNVRPAPTVGGADFRDPTRDKIQPPLVANSPVKTCGLLNGQIAPIGGTPVVVGPYNYYSYIVQGGVNVPDGKPITLNGGTVTFSASGTCPGVLSTTGAAQSGSFPNYFFYGGLAVQGDANFGPGQYVLVGAKPQLDGAASPSLWFDGNHNTTGDSTTGTMFISTAPGYAGLDTQINAFPELQAASSGLMQGFADFKSGNSASITLSGVKSTSNALPANLDIYNGFIFWQDRRNSQDELNLNNASCVRSPNCNATAGELAANKVPADLSSIKLLLEPSHSNLHFTGVFYQPRGAYFTATGGGGVQNASLQVITGAVQLQGGVSVTLTAPTNPMIRFVNALIQ